MRQTTKATVKRAKSLRRNLTLPEGLLWRELRGKRGGLKFRRQHPVGAYVLDLYCPSVRLAVEVDGKAHDMGDGPARDERRDAFLAERGIEVIRVAAQRVLDSPEESAEAIVRLCQARLD